MTMNIPADCTVIPAKAGISGQEVSAGLPETPAFAGVTRLFAGVTELVAGMTGSSLPGFAHG
jgi:hypothetical protein